MKMALGIPSRRAAYIVVVTLLTCGLQSCRSNPVGGSDVTALNDSGSKVALCSSTSCLNRTLLEKAFSFVNSSSPNNRLSNGPKGDRPLDIRSSEFALLYNILEGIMHRFTDANIGSRTTSIVTSTNGTEKVITDEYGKSKYSSTIPPALIRNLKILVPPFLSELLVRLNESFGKDLSKDGEDQNKSSSESTGLLESFRQTMLDLAHDKPKNDDKDGQYESNSNLKKELDEILNKLKHQVQRPTKKDKVDELCNMFEEHVKSRIQYINEISSNNEDENRIVVALKKTTEVVCRDSNKKLLKKLANSQKIWANRITKRVLARAIDRISKGKPLLRSILDMIMSVIVENPQQS